MKKLLVILCLLVVWLNSFATNYYFSNSGNDGNAGTIGSPWASINKFNSVFASKLPGDIFLFNRGDLFTGTMIISRNGTSGAPMTIGAYGTGADPVFTGFTTVTAWTNLGSNIWESTSAISTLATLNMVAINGVNTAMGRTPNYPSYYTYSSANSTSLTSGNLNSSATNWTGAELVDFLTTYTIARHTISGHSGSTINYSGNADPQTPGFPFTFFIQNDTRTLDVQNEWYYNPSTKKIRVYSTSAPTNVQVATIDNLVTCTGRSYIMFDNITFIGSNKDAILLGSSNHIIVQNSNFNYIGNDVLYNGGGNNKVDNCEISNCNNFGIDFNDNTFDTVSNNYVHNIGMLIGMGAIPTPSIGSNGINTTGANTFITLNRVDTCGGMGIRYGGSNTVVSNNFVQHFVMGNGVSDGGGIYIYGGSSGTPTTNIQCLNNVVINGGPGAGADIYCDDFANGVTVAGNTTANGNDGYQFHNNQHMIIRDNTAYNHSQSSCLLLFDQAGVSGNSTNITLKNNIFFQRDPPNSANDQNSWCMWNNTFNTVPMPSPFISDSNYYCRPITDANSGAHTIVGFLKPGDIETDMNLAMWQARNGQDAHSQKSPRTITNVNQLRFEYNATTSPTSVNLGSTGYVDARNVAYSGTITLQPFTSVVLFSTGVGNTPPTANAGSNQTITWPTNSVTLSGSGIDADGTIAAYAWSKISGPASNGITNAGSPTATVTGLTPGVYQFQLQITDNSGGTATDVMQVTLNQQAASLSFSGPTLSQVYTGGPLSVGVITSPPGLTVDVLYNGVSTPPILPGSYLLNAGLRDGVHYTFTPITGTFTITKGNAVISALSQTFNFDGLTHGITASVSPNTPGLTYLYDGATSTPPSSVGVHSVHITLVSSIYTATPVDVTVTIVSNSALIFISDTFKIYNGTPQSVTVTSPYSYSLTGSPQTNAGVYAQSANINDGVHSGSANANMTIAKATGNFTWPQPVAIPFGSQLTAGILNATSDVPGNFTYDHPIGEVPPIGSETITATFHPSDPSNFNGGTIFRVVNVFAVSPFDGGNFILIGPSGQILFIKQ